MLFYLCRKALFILVAFLRNEMVCESRSLRLFSWKGFRLRRYDQNFKTVSAEHSSNKGKNKVTKKKILMAW